jgi:hypothetical protein
MREAVERCRLNLHGSTVLTEAAAGAYVVTPVLAAMAGAERVYAFTRDSRYGTVAEVTAQTLEMAQAARVEGTVKIIVEKSPEVIAQADIATNSGHLRPIDRMLIGQMKDTAVVPLMYESWECRTTDIDIHACREKGIAIAGTNERDPRLDVFSYLGIMAVKLVLDAGVAVYGSRILLLCDNPFAPYIESGLSRAGASVTLAPTVSETRAEELYDAIVLASTPAERFLLREEEAKRIACIWPGVVVCQFWGDINRNSFATHKVPVWPSQPPHAGHMAILPSAVGPEPVVRLQTGGLKVGELLWRARKAGCSPQQAVERAVESGFADRWESLAAPPSALKVQGFQ